MSEEQAVEVNETPSPEVVTDLNTTDSETEAQVDESTQQDNPLPKPEKQQSKFDRRIAQLNRKIGEERARAEYLAKQVEELKPKPEIKSDGLKLEDFDFDVDKYADAKAKLSTDRALQELEQKRQSELRSQTHKQLASDWLGKAEKAAVRYDDFDEVSLDLSRVDFSTASPVVIAVLQAENSADIAYYLGANPAELKRIDSLDPVAAIREIGRLEAKLLASPPKEKEPSKLPAPITPVKGSGMTSKSFLDDNLSQKEFEKLRRDAIKRR